MLKETIDRLRFDLDEIRTVTANSPAGGSSASSMRSTMGLGSGGKVRKGVLDWAAEMGGETAEGGEDNDNPVKEEVDEQGGFVETIVTTSRRRVSAPLTLSMDFDINFFFRSLARRSEVTTPGNLQSQYAKSSLSKNIVTRSHNTTFRSSRRLHSRKLTLCRRSKGS